MLGVSRFERYGGSKIYRTRTISEMRFPGCSRTSSHSKLTCAFHLPSLRPIPISLLFQGSALQSLPQRHWPTFILVFLNFCKTYHLPQTFHLTVLSLGLFYSCLKYPRARVHFFLRDTEFLKARDCGFCMSLPIVCSIVLEIQSAVN